MRRKPDRDCTIGIGMPRRSWAERDFPLLDAVRRPSDLRGRRGVLGNRDSAKMLRPSNGRTAIEGFGGRVWQAD